jgi:hypothetical protein
MENIFLPKIENNVPVVIPHRTDNKIFFEEISLMDFTKKYYPDLVSILKK